MGGEEREIARERLSVVQRRLRRGRGEAGPLLFLHATRSIHEELKMQSVEEFLAYAINVETEAASRFGQLADAMEACGNRRRGQTVSSAVGLLQTASRRCARAVRLSRNSKDEVRGFRLARVGKPGDSGDLGRRSVHWPGTGSGDRARRRNGGLRILQERARNDVRSGNQSAGEGVRRGGGRPCRRTPEMDRRA